MFKKELEALKRAGRFRQRRVFKRELKDFASNDYLGLAHKSEILYRAYERVKDFGQHGAKASQLICGYTPLHQALEERLCQLNGFEAGALFGSGFLANFALEALVRRGDLLLLDEEFHASGILAAKLISNVAFFRHNDSKDLEEKLSSLNYRRVVVAVEGIYSMSGDMVKKEVLEAALRYGLLYIDEAHSSGVVGKNLLGVLNFYGIEPRQNIIKMGTMGKAYGSYGAYILASKEVISFLENRAKSLIYTTSLSVMDVALALEAIDYIAKHKESIFKAIEKRRTILREYNLEKDGLIADIRVKNPLILQERLIEEGFLVGAIRAPTVKEPIIRIIPRLGQSQKDLRELLELLKGWNVLV